MIDPKHEDTTRHRLSRRICLGGLLLMAANGCASYQLGNASLFPTSIQTIHIPVIRSDSFRPDLGVRLTEAIQKRVEERTPYKIVDDVVADSRLVCRLTTDSKRVVTETITDEPRQIKTFFTVESSWTDRQGNVLMENRFLPPAKPRSISLKGPTSFQRPDRAWRLPNKEPSSASPITSSIKWNLVGEVVAVNPAEHRS